MIGNKRHTNRKENLSLFADDVIDYIENPKESTNKRKNKKAPQKPKTRR